MSVPLRVMLATDSFPPICGGSGWSTYELARGLAARGHHIEIVKTEIGRSPGVHEGKYESFRVTTLRGQTPDVPVVRNVIKNERMWANLSKYLITERLQRESARLNTDADVYGGANIGNGGGIMAEDAPSHGRPYSLSLTLPPLGTVILEHQPH